MPDQNPPRVLRQYTPQEAGRAALRVQLAVDVFKILLTGYFADKQTIPDECVVPHTLDMMDSAINVADAMLGKLGL